MNKQIIKIFFVDFWPDIVNDNYFLDFLKRYYTVEIDPNNPDYLFFSVYGQTHLKYNHCIKILFTGENMVPDFNVCDYALGFHYLQFEDRYARYPLYLIYSGFGRLQHKMITDEKSLLNRSFCNFVYSNNTNADTTRDLFFQKLSKYKKVDSGGKHLNNIGGPVEDKINFIKNYKFTIAFENSAVPGYTTEKLMDAMCANSIPVYYGNPLAHLDFNPESFIQVKGVDDFERAIEEIIFLDNDPAAYLGMLNKQWINNGYNLEMWEQQLFNFLNHIFSQPLVNAKRKAEYGFNKFNNDVLQLQADLLYRRKRINNFKAKIKSYIGK